MEVGFFKNYDEQYEEDVFWILIHLMYEKNWRSIYKPKFPKVHEMCRYFEKMMQVHVKEVHNLIMDNEVNFFRSLKDKTSLIIHSSASLIFFMKRSLL